MTKDIMDVKEVASYLGFSPTKIYRMLTAAQIPYVKVGGQYRFPRQVIDEWLAGKLEVPRSARSAKSTRGARKDREQPATVRVEDEIVGHLLASRSSGSREGTDKAKQLMLDQIEQLDMPYLASKAKAAGVLEEAVTAQNELITEATR
jgi:excisionase family DNA binding protein